MYKDDRVKQAFEMIEQGVKDVYTSDKFTEYLQMISKFHNYSMNNIILILNQYPSATLVAGYNSWRDNFKRHVNKGEKAIRILVPVYIFIIIKSINNCYHNKKHIDYDAECVISSFCSYSVKKIDLIEII